MGHFFIQAFAAINTNGIYSLSKGYTPWNEDQKRGPYDIQRNQAYDKPFVGFGKLNIADKLAFGAAALVLSDFPEYNGERTGICLGNIFGCLSTDLRYAESVMSGFPSPAYFAATLPSSPVADIAILFKLKGPDRVIAGSAFPGFCALENAMQVISFNKADSMVVLLVNGIETQDMHFPLIIADENNCNYSYAFMLSKEKSRKGMNYKISLTLDKKTNNTMQNISEEFYFLEMINAMMQKNNYTSSFTLNSMSGSLSLEKDT